MVLFSKATDMGWARQFRWRIRKAFLTPSPLTFSAPPYSWFLHWHSNNRNCGWRVSGDHGWLWSSYGSIGAALSRQSMERLTLYIGVEVVAVTADSGNRGREYWLILLSKWRFFVVAVVTIALTHLAFELWPIRFNKRVLHKYRYLAMYWQEGNAQIRLGIGIVLLGPALVCPIRICRTATATVTAVTMKTIRA